VIVSVTLLASPLARHAHSPVVTLARFNICFSFFSTDFREKETARSLDSLDSNVHSLNSNKRARISVVKKKNLSPFYYFLRSREQKQYGA